MTYGGQPRGKLSKCDGKAVYLHSEVDAERQDVAAYLIRKTTIENSTYEAIIIAAGMNDVIEFMDSQNRIRQCNNAEYHSLKFCEEWIKTLDQLAKHLYHKTLLIVF